MLGNAHQERARYGAPFCIAVSFGAPCLGTEGLSNGGTYADRAIYSTSRLAMLERYGSPSYHTGFAAVALLSSRLVARQARHGTAAVGNCVARRRDRC